MNELIAITGATGLLGSFMVRRLAHEGVPFVALKRSTSNVSHLGDIKEEITWRDCDLLDPVSTTEALTGVTGVIHAAGLVSFSPANRRKVFKANFTATSTLVDVCLQSGIPRLLYVSSSSVFLGSVLRPVITEDDAFTVPQQSHYAESKYLAELEVFRGQEEGLHTVIVNPPVIFSRYNWDRSAGRLFNYVSNGGLFYMDGDVNYVDIRDLTEVMLRLYRSPVENDRFIVSAGKITFKNLIEKVAVIMDRKVPPIRVGRSPLRLLAFIENIRTRFLVDEPIFTNENLRTLDSDFLLSSDKIKNVLNFEFQPIDETLRWCCQSEA